MEHSGKTLLTILLGGIVVVVASLFSCDLFGTSPSSRVSQFTSDLNNVTERNVYVNFHYDMPGWDSWNDAAFSTTEFGLSHQSFSIEITSGVLDSSVPGVKYATGLMTSTNSTWSPQTIQFNFKEESPGDWYILAIALPDPGEYYWGTFTY